jgi:ketosteroid isomerase-like protein
MSTPDPTSGKQELIRALFLALDRGDVQTVSSYLDTDVIVVLTNQKPIHGTAAFAALYKQVAGTLAGFRHEIRDVWSAAEDPEVWITRMTVHYSRLDGQTISLPCCTVFRFADALITEYQVFEDMTPVFA